MIGHIRIFPTTHTEGTLAAHTLSILPFCFFFLVKPLPDNTLIKSIHRRFTPARSSQLAPYHTGKMKVRTVVATKSYGYDMAT